jgi:hypothetical protein
VERKAEPVEERLQVRGDLEGVDGRGEDDAVGPRHLLDQQVPVVGERAEFLNPDEARLAADTRADVVLAQERDLASDVAERLQAVEETSRGRSPRACARCRRGR